MLTQRRFIKEMSRVSPPSSFSCKVTRLPRHTNRHADFRLRVMRSHGVRLTPRQRKPTRQQQLFVLRRQVTLGDGRIRKCRPPVTFRRGPARTLRPDPPRTTVLSAKKTGADPNYKGYNRNIPIGAANPAFRVAFVPSLHLRAASMKPKSLQTSVSKRGARAESFLVSLLVL